MNIIQKAQQLVFVIHDNVTLLVLDHLDVFVLLPKGFSFSLPPRCSLFFRRTFKPPEGEIQRSCSSWFVAFVRRELNGAQHHVKAHWHLRGSPPQRRYNNIPPSRSPLPTLMGKRCPTLAFPNKYTQQCQTNILFVQRQHFVYENITTIKQKATTKKKQSQPKNEKQTKKSTIVQFLSLMNLFSSLGLSVWFFQGQLVAVPSRVAPAWVCSALLTQKLVPALANT